MSVESRMDRVGTLGDRSLYYAAPEHFAHPGYFVWNGSRHEFVGFEPHDVIAHAARNNLRLAVTHPNYEARFAVLSTHTFQGAPDARQSDDSQMPTSRFRPRYRALSPDEKALHDAIKAKAEELEALIGKVLEVRRAAGQPDVRPTPADTGLPAPQPLRYLALATTSLEESVMWAVKALTA